MTPLYLDFHHDADSAHVHRHSLEMVTCYLHLTDDVLVKYTTLKSQQAEQLHQWTYRDGTEQDRRDYRTMAASGWGFPDTNAAVPTDRLASLLADVFNPLQSHMFAQAFAERFTPVMSWIGDWFLAHTFQPHRPVTDEQVEAMALFSTVLTEKLETMRETLELDALTCGGVVGA